MGLLHLVERPDAVRPSPDRLGQLTAFLIPDVSGRRADEPGNGVPFGVLAHVDPDHGPLVVEQELSERFSQLGLANAGRPEEQERAGRAVRIGNAGPGPADRTGRRPHGPGLAPDPAPQLLLRAPPRAGPA